VKLKRYKRSIRRKRKQK